MSELNKYMEFLEKKKQTRVESGFNVEEKDLNPALFPFQKYCVRRALAAGKFALFEDCGLGKTIQQLEWSQKVAEHIDRPILILAPLAVISQTIKEGDKFGYVVKEISETRFGEDLDTGIYITNYDNMEHIDAYHFGGIVLDESSILKNFQGKTRTALIDEFRNTPYKLACTATPSPNDTTEICNHSEFLDVMSRTEMLAMYFVHDGGSTSDWRLKGHAKQSFWDFVSTWAVMLNKPSDIGFDDAGYDLPPLNVIQEIVVTPKRDNGMLFNDTAVNATDFHKELRETYQIRLDRVADIVNAKPDENFIIWIGHDDEGKYLRKLLPDAIEVKGSDSKQFKKDMLLGFGRGEFRVLITKLKIAQFGLNYQNCHNQIYASLDFSFEATYQGIRRSYRFGQTDTVNIYLITTDTMQNVKDSFDKKQQAFREMQESMTMAMNRNIKNQITLKKMEVTNEYKSDYCHIKLGDCVKLISEVPDNSVGFSIFSPPFAELYTYSDKLEDMGNSKDYKEFFTAFKFLVSELYRVMWAGRNVAVHCMDLPIQKGKEGFIGLRDFSGMILQAFEEVGFIYHSRVTIWKNPVTEMQRTKALGLLHKQVKKDSAMSRVGIPDYLMIFRKEGEHTHPVHCDISVDTWQKWASPVWMDIDYGNTLNASRGRDQNDEKHICPLQLDTIERAISLWSNEGDTVLTPFLGIGSEVYSAIKLNRYGIGFELKDSYFNEAVKNCKGIEITSHQPSLFSAI
jgi:DNA modification methylase